MCRLSVSVKTVPGLSSPCTTRPYRLQTTELLRSFSLTKGAHTPRSQAARGVFFSGGGEIRTLERFPPTRFPSERTRPLCDASRLVQLRDYSTKLLSAYERCDALLDRRMRHKKLGECTCFGACAERILNVKMRGCVVGTLHRR